MLAVLGATLAMVGLGDWSIGARLFGRNHIQTPDFLGRSTRQLSAPAENW